MHRLATLDELADLTPITRTVGGCAISVVRIDDDVYAFDAYCSHRPAPLADGAVTRKRTVLCPWHLGTFRLRDGSVVAGPPEAPIRTFAVVVRDGVVYARTDSGTMEAPTEWISGDSDAT